MRITIELRGTTAADLPVLFEHQADAEGARLVGGPSRGRDDFMAHWARTSADPAVRRETIVFEGAVAGYVGRFERLGVPEVCYWLGREFWGKGIATEALALFLAGEKTRPLWGRVAKRNPASVRVLEKCGFAITGEDKYSNRAGEEIEEFVLKLTGS